MVKPVNDVDDSLQVRDAQVKINEYVSQLFNFDTTCRLKTSTPVGEAAEAEVFHTSQLKRKHLVGNEEVMEKEDILNLFIQCYNVHVSQESSEKTK